MTIFNSPLAPLAMGPTVVDGWNNAGQENMHRVVLRATRCRASERQSFLKPGLFYDVVTLCQLAELVAVWHPRHTHTSTKRSGP